MSRMNSLSFAESQLDFDPEQTSFRSLEDILSALDAQPDMSGFDPRTERRSASQLLAERGYNFH